MSEQQNFEYYQSKTDEELDVLVAEAAGLKLAYLSNEGGWLDSNGVLVHLKSEFHPTSKTNYAIELLREVAAEGNGVAINTADIITQANAITIGGFPFSSGVELPLITNPVDDINSFGDFRKTFLRSICIFYILYKNSRE